MEKKALEIVEKPPNRPRKLKNEEKKSAKKIGGMAASAEANTIHKMADNLVTDYQNDDSLGP